MNVGTEATSLISIILTQSFTGFMNFWRILFTRVTSRAARVCGGVENEFYSVKIHHKIFSQPAALSNVRKDFIDDLSMK